MNYASYTRLPLRAEHPRQKVNGIFWQRPAIHQADLPTLGTMQGRELWGIMKSEAHTRKEMLALDVPFADTHMAYQPI